MLVLNLTCAPLRLFYVLPQALDLVVKILYRIFNIHVFLVPLVKFFKTSFLLWR